MLSNIDWPLHMYHPTTIHHIGYRREAGGGGSLGFLPSTSLWDGMSFVLSNEGEYYLITPHAKLTDLLFMLSSLLLGILPVRTKRPTLNMFSSDTATDLK